MVFSISEKKIRKREVAGTIQDKNIVETEQENSYFLKMAETVDYFCVINRQ